MKRKTIVFGVALAAFLMLMMPCVSSFGIQKVKDKKVPLDEIIPNKKILPDQDPTATTWDSYCDVVFPFSGLKINGWVPEYICIYGAKFKYRLNNEDTNMICDWYQNENFDKIVDFFVELLDGLGLPAGIISDIIEFFYDEDINTICDKNEGNGVKFTVICCIIGIPAIPVIVSGSIKPL